MDSILVWYNYYKVRFGSFGLVQLKDELSNCFICGVTVPNLFGLVLITFYHLLFFIPPLFSVVLQLVNIGHHRFALVHHVYRSVTELHDGKLSSKSCWIVDYVFLVIFQEIAYFSQLFLSSSDLPVELLNGIAYGLCCCTCGGKMPFIITSGLASLCTTPANNYPPFIMGLLSIRYYCSGRN